MLGVSIYGLYEALITVYLVQLAFIYVSSLSVDLFICIYVPFVSLCIYVHPGLYAYIFAHSYLEFYMCLYVILSNSNPHIHASSVYTYTGSLCSTYLVAA